MDKTEARTIVQDVLADFRGRPYAELASLVGESQRREVAGACGATYQVEIEAVWDSGRNGDVRVIGAIDDGGWRAFLPLTVSFIVAPDGTFVGE